MYEVCVEDVFSAAHRLRLADGRLEPPHGHDWRVIVVFRGDELDEAGMLVDFVHVRRKLNEVVSRLHHTDLNENPVMRGMNPSAEHVARVIYELIADDPAMGKNLHRATVTEAPFCRASYSGRAEGA